MVKNKSYDKADYKRELYDALVKSYQTDKDIFDTYGEVFMLKRSRDDGDKDQDPFVGSNRWTKRWKSSKEAELSGDSRSSYARVMVELKADVELKDNIVVDIPRIYTCAGEKKTVKKPSQTSQGVSVGPKIVNNEATLSGSSFMNIDNDEECASNTPIGAKIKKIEPQIGKGKLRLFDNDGNLLVTSGIMESNCEVEVIFDETANLRIPMSGKDGSDKDYGTNSLLER
uniref:Uncharacterized protein n=1 Tax=Tanacetum cinerariifolium TaxID=118510 RepID=A0A6L2NUV9_TANCI|nr:hypothetical protein [Tanacetum cinerariifolium]